MIIAGRKSNKKTPCNRCLMANALNVYHPSGHFEREAAQLKVLSNAAMVLSGEKALRMAVVDFPFSSEATESFRMASSILK